MIYSADVLCKYVDDPLWRMTPVDAENGYYDIDQQPRQILSTAGGLWWGRR